jgi:poly-gamma-glutamate synthesis protein (capsule biosynthesis protein)
VVSRRVRRRRTEFALGGFLFLVLIIYLAAFSGGSGKPTASTSTTTSSSGSAHVATLADQHFPKNSPLNPDWKGNGKTVTLGFGGDVHFEGVVGEKLAQNPSTALGTTIPQLFAGSNMSMVNLETAVTDGTCPEPQNKQYIFDAPASAVTALKSASISVVTEGNDHGFDCGPQGLSQNLTIASQDSYPIIGIGNSAQQAFAPYRVTLNGQRIAVISATQIIADNLVSTWTASASQPGVASAIDPTALVHEVQQVRKTADTVIVYLHWGTETQTCPNPQQEPLAQQVVNAGADIVVGSNTHVLSGAGYLGSAYVDYGLGNFAFYDNAAPETDSGSLIISAQGRHVTSAVWRPATIVSGLPQPLSGQAATAAIDSWNGARSCTNLSAKPATSVATLKGETKTFVAPPTTTTTTSATGSSGNSTATTTSGSGAPTTSSTRAPATTTTAPAPTTTRPTDNAGG